VARARRWPRNYDGTPRCDPRAGDVLGVADAGRLPAGIALGPGQTDVRFDTVFGALQKLFTLAPAITNDYDRFAAICIERKSGSGGVDTMNDEVGQTVLVPFGEGIVAPALVAEAGKKTAGRPSMVSARCPGPRRRRRRSRSLSPRADPGNGRLACGAAGRSWSR
jgi:hypothetical protein